MRKHLLFFGLGFLTLASAWGAAPAADENELVEIRKVDPTIVIELRYASANNFVHRAIYPPAMPALIRASVAQRLIVAQNYLSERGYGLKIWDAYRPQDAQQQLFKAMGNRSYVADPTGQRGSYHTRGVAVDATLVDRSGQEVAMPTGFDNFTPAAMLAYRGDNALVRFNLTMLQKAMARAGFYGLRTEWWHFCAGDYAKYPLVPQIKLPASLAAPAQ
ncbi:MAG: zinc D-Ala-D-Ala dipeptidase [Verrucomicrobiota bacterium]|jgi:D-alanyl-D-alanine dipeptidase